MMMVMVVRIARRQSSPLLRPGFQLLHSVSERGNLKKVSDTIGFTIIYWHLCFFTNPAVFNVEENIGIIVVQICVELVVQNGQNGH